MKKLFVVIAILSLLFILSSCKKEDAVELPSELEYYSEHMGPDDDISVKLYSNDYLGRVPFSFENYEIEKELWDILDFNSWQLLDESFYETDQWIGFGIHTENTFIAYISISSNDFIAVEASDPNPQYFKAADGTYDKLAEIALPYLEELAEVREF